MPKGVFGTYHPAVCMLFFLGAICLSFCSMQPVYVAITLIASILYFAYLRGIRRVGKMLLMFIPLLLFIALLNSLFNSYGATVIWEWEFISISLEGCAYCLAIGGILAAVLMWFACYNEVMTEDKFTYLFGFVAPTLSLVVSMVSRWVPRMASRGRNIFEAQESLIGAYDTSKGGLTKRGVRMATVLAGLGMEDSIQTSDSMRARGYGTNKRTSYARYSWHARERVALVAIIVLIAVNAVLMYLGTASFEYYPRIDAITWWWGYVTYSILLLMPLILEVEQVVRKLQKGGRTPTLSPAMQALYTRPNTDAINRVPTPEAAASETAPETAPDAGEHDSAREETA